MTSGARALLAALFACNVALAQPSWGIHELMRDLRAVKTIDASFVETKHLSALSAPLELSGTLAYRAPDRLEKRTLHPIREQLLLQGDTVTLDDGRRKRSFSLERDATMRAFVESIRATLAGDGETLSRYYDIALSGNAAAWRLALTPSEPAVQTLVSEIRIAGRHAWVDTFEVRQASGERSVMSISRTAP
jgi:Outer membrane lipoprotein carrier protein LolA-like